MQRRKRDESFPSLEERCLVQPGGWAQRAFSRRSCFWGLRPDQPNSLTLTLSDNGPGIPESVRASVFTPFFTTKPEGERAGLGLSVAREIMAVRSASNVLPRAGPL